MAAHWIVRSRHTHPRNGHYTRSRVSVNFSRHKQCKFPDGGIVASARPYVSCFLALCCLNDALAYGRLIYLVLGRQSSGHRSSVVYPHSISSKYHPNVQISKLDYFFTEQNKGIKPVDDCRGVNRLEVLKTTVLWYKYSMMSRRVAPALGGYVNCAVVPVPLEIIPEAD